MMLNVLPCIGQMPPVPPPPTKSYLHTHAHTGIDTHTHTRIPHCTHHLQSKLYQWFRAMHTLGPPAIPLSSPISLQSLSCSPCPSDSQTTLHQDVLEDLFKHRFLGSGPGLQNLHLSGRCCCCLSGDHTPRTTNLYHPFFTSDPVPRLQLLSLCTPQGPARKPAPPPIPLWCPSGKNVSTTTRSQGCGSLCGHLVSFSIDSYLNTCLASQACSKVSRWKRV